MQYDIQLTPRKDVPQWIVYGTPVFTVVAALIVTGFALVALGFDPVEGFYYMFVDTLTTGYGLSDTLTRAVPLILAGLAVYIPLKANLWNIGAEGQLILGAAAGTYVALNLSAPMYILLPTMFLASALAGAVWGGIPGWLRAKWDINEIITTLLMTFIAINLLSYIVRGPMRGDGGNYPQTDLLPAVAQLPDIPGIGVNVGLILAIGSVVATYLLLTRTHLGFQITVVGSNENAAVQSGIDKARIYLFVLVAGGVFAAFAGISEIAGNQSRLQSTFEPGYGFAAIPIALLGRNSAFKLMLAAVFFAVLFVGGQSMSIAIGVPSALIEIIQALVILFLITAEFFKRYEIEIVSEQQMDQSQNAATGGEI